MSKIIDELEENIKGMEAHHEQKKKLPWLFIKITRAVFTYILKGRRQKGLE